MKKIMKKIIFLGLIILSTSSCLNDFLEVEPLSVISTEIYWKSEKDVRAELNSAYANIQQAYNAGYLNWYESRSDNFIGNSGGSYPYQNINFNKLDASLPACSWNQWYRVVSIANHALHFIPLMDNVMTDQNRNHYLSEAYFLRAFAYFNLYRIWGDVPLVTEPVLSRTDVTKPAKVDKAKIMELINADLIEADKLVNTSVAELFIYSPAALYALTTDVAMWNHDYEKAILFSQKLLDLQLHTLDGVDFKLVCSNAETKDNIFTLKWSFVSNGINRVVFTYYNTADALVPARPIYIKWSAPDYAQDLRRSATLNELNISLYGSSHLASQPAARIWKWSPGQNIHSDYMKESYLPIYRLADILLLRAEALNKTGKYTEAIIEVNKVRKRAGLADRTLVDYTDPVTLQFVPDSLENSILQERQFELFAEGKRWFDLMRTGKVMSVMNDYFDNYIAKYHGRGYKKLTAEWQLYWPVKQDILNENENLIQTGDY